MGRAHAQSMMMHFVYCLIAIVALCGAVPQGHKRPIFELPNYKGGVEEWPEGKMPKVSDFFQKYASGWGKPFIMRGAAKQMPAFKKWRLDTDMASNYPDAVFSQIEFAKKETRAAPARSMNVGKFLAEYNTSDAYVVSQVPKQMAADVWIPDLMKCGYATQYLDVNNMWMSSGGTKSVIHNDDQDNINCVLSGEKRFFIVDARNKTYIENEECGWMIADEEARKDPNYKGYGAYGGRMDVDSMDLEKYPRWAEVPWYDAKMKPGDCLYIPTSWYHHVLSHGRNVAINIWWWRRDPIKMTTEELDACPDRDKKITLGDCQFGYEGPPEDNTGGFSGRMTSCNGMSPAKEKVDAHSFITRWQRFPERQLFAALRSKGVKDVTKAPIEQQVAIMEEYWKQRESLPAHMKASPEPQQEADGRDEADDGDAQDGQDEM